MTIGTFTEADSVISAENLSKAYNGIYAVRDATFEILAGEIYGLAGRNGAGKTTLIRMITNLIKPSAGSFSVLPHGGKTDTSVAAVVEKPSFYPDLTAYNNLVAQCKLLGIEGSEKYLKSTLELVGLKPDLRILAKNFSLGMKQRLGLAMTLVGKPSILILDEPTNGLDPEGILEMRELLVKLNREMGVTVLVSSHILSELSKFATKYIFMEKGRIIKIIDAKEINAETKKVTTIVVSDGERTADILREKGLSFSQKNENTLEIFDDLPTTRIVLMLSENGIDVSSINSNSSGDLESYFMNLVGGKHD